MAKRVDDPENIAQTIEAMVLNLGGDVRIPPKYFRRSTYPGKVATDC